MAVAWASSEGGVSADRKRVAQRKGRALCLVGEGGGRPGTDPGEAALRSGLVGHSSVVMTHRHSQHCSVAAAFPERLSSFGEAPTGTDLVLPSALGLIFFVCFPPRKPRIPTSTG